MATRRDEDEFDTMPDDLDFGAIADDEWNAIQTQNQPSNVNGRHVLEDSQLPEIYEGDNLLGAYSSEITVPVPEFVQGSSDLRPEPVTESGRSRSPSSAYSLNESEDFDDAFLQQLDELENQIINGPRATSPATAAIVLPEVSTTPESSFNNVYDMDSPPMKRRRVEESNEDLEIPVKKGKRKFEGDWTELLDEYDDEINCPICCDILVASHLVNGCGHTLCGSCGYQWIVEKHRNTCPVCRAQCHALTPLIPNITADNFVHKHLRVRARLGDEDWQVGGWKLLEWQARKEKWKNECEQRVQRSKKAPFIVIRPRIDNWHT